jgi:hypothetical protein
VSVIAVLMVVVLIARIDAEERLLSETFVTEYEAARSASFRCR